MCCVAHVQSSKCVYQRTPDLDLQHAVPRDAAHSPSKCTAAHGIFTAPPTLVCYAHNLRAGLAVIGNITARLQACAAAPPQPAAYLDPTFLGERKFLPVDTVNTSYYQFGPLSEATTGALHSVVLLHRIWLGSTAILIHVAHASPSTCATFSLHAPGPLLLSLRQTSIVC